MLPNNPLTGVQWRKNQLFAVSKRKIMEELFRSFHFSLSIISKIVGVLREFCSNVLHIIQFHRKFIIHMNTSWMQRVVLFEYLWAIFNEWGVNTTEKIPVHCIWILSMIRINWLLNKCLKVNKANGTVDTENRLTISIEALICKFKRFKEAGKRF